MHSMFEMSEQITPKVCRLNSGARALLALRFARSCGAAVELTLLRTTTVGSAAFVTKIRSFTTVLGFYWLFGVHFPNLWGLLRSLFLFASSFRQVLI